MIEQPPIPDFNEIVKSPAFYTSVEAVLNTNRNHYEAFLNQGNSPEEALSLTFKKQLESPRTADQDIDFINKAMERGYED